MTCTAGAGPLEREAKHLPGPFVVSLPTPAEKGPAQGSLQNPGKVWELTNARGWPPWQAKKKNREDAGKDSVQPDTGGGGCFFKWAH